MQEIGRYFLYLYLDSCDIVTPSNNSCDNNNNNYNDRFNLLPLDFFSFHHKRLEDLDFFEDNRNVVAKLLLECSTIHNFENHIVMPSARIN
uniref:Uncharacterized protein n=1 Tax=Glossina palpalis gambiensis TaxID=67801 RepID=A0A1B0AUE6_9MUSC